MHTTIPLEIFVIKRIYELFYAIEFFCRTVLTQIILPNPEAFDIAVNMLNINPAFRDERICFLFFRRQFAIFGDFYWSGAVGVNLDNALIALVGKNLSVRRKMDTTILQQGKIMFLSC